MDRCARLQGRDGIANTTELAGALELKTQTVSHELGRLESAGLVHRAERQGQKGFFIGVPSEFWGLCRELRDNATRMLDSVPRY